KPRNSKHYQGKWRDIARLKAADAVQQQRAETAEQAAAGQLPGPFAVRSRLLPGADDPCHLDPFSGERRANAPARSDFETDGIFDTEACCFLSNFTVTIDEEVEVLDDLEKRSLFRGKLKVFGREHPFEINARDFADNNKLKAAIYEAGGIKAVIYGKVDSL